MMMGDQSELVDKWQEQISEKGDGNGCMEILEAVGELRDEEE